MLVQAWRLLNVAGAGWCFAWCLQVGWHRWRTGDLMQGHWLAVGLGLMYLGAVVGGTYSLSVSQQFQPGMPFVTASIVVVGWARWTTRRSERKEEP